MHRICLTFTTTLGHGWNSLRALIVTDKEGGIQNHLFKVITPFSSLRDRQRHAGLLTADSKIHTQEQAILCRL